MYRFIVASPRLGQKEVKGPVTGEKIILTTTGGWVKTADAEQLVKMEFDVFCAALHKVISRKAVFYGRPTADQMVQKPKE